MKKKLTMLLLATGLALSACGGSSTGGSPATAGGSGAIQTAAPAAGNNGGATEFTMDPVMADTNWGDCIVQVDDIVIDFYNTQFKDIKALFEEKGGYTFSDVTHLQSGADLTDVRSGDSVKIAVMRGEEDIVYLWCTNPTKSEISIDDTIVSSVSTEHRYEAYGVVRHNNIWLPTGFRVDYDESLDDFLAYLEETKASEYCDIERQGNMYRLKRKENGDRYNNKGIDLTPAYVFNYSKEGVKREIKLVSPGNEIDAKNLVDDINEVLKN